MGVNVRDVDREVSVRRPQLVHLYAERGSPKYERAAMRCLERYLAEGSPRLQHFAEVTTSLDKRETDLASYLRIEARELDGRYELAAGSRVGTAPMSSAGALTAGGSAGMESGASIDSPSGFGHEPRPAIRCTNVNFICFLVVDGAEHRTARGGLADRGSSRRAG
jgi:hypothetical protein